MPTPTDIPLSTYQVSNAQYSQSEIILTQAFKASHWNCLVMYLSTICLIDKLTYLFPFLILFSTFFSPFSLFLVACTRLYKSLSVGPSVRLSVGPSIHPSVRHTVGFSMFYWVFVSFYHFSQHFTSFHKFSQVFTSFHKFSQVFTSFHKFSQVFTSFSHFSQVFTIFSHFSHFHIFSNESTRLMAMALFSLDFALFCLFWGSSSRCGGPAPGPNEPLGWSSIAQHGVQSVPAGGSIWSKSGLIPT